MGEESVELMKEMGGGITLYGLHAALTDGMYMLHEYRACTHTGPIGVAEVLAPTPPKRSAGVHVQPHDAKALHGARHVCGEDERGPSSKPYLVRCRRGCCPTVRPPAPRLPPSANALATGSCMRPPARLQAVGKPHPSKPRAAFESVSEAAPRRCERIECSERI